MSQGINEQEAALPPLLRAEVLRAGNLMKALVVCRCLLFAAAMLLAVSGAAHADETAIFTGKVRTTVTRAPGVPFNCVVKEVLVQPGQHVKEGDPLFRYELAIDVRRNLQMEINVGSNVEHMQAQVLDLRRQLSQAQAQRNRARSLAASGLGSSQASERLQFEVDSLEERIRLTNESIAKSRANFDLRLKELSQRFGMTIEEGQPLPEVFSVNSLLDGYVLSMDSNLMPGTWFGGGAAPVSVGQMDPMLIEVPVYEAEVSVLKVGDKATVEIPSLNNKAFEATVTEISWASSQMDVSQASYFNVELTIPNPNLELKPGFKAVVRFTLR